MINSLIGAAADREPSVRITALRALGSLSPGSDSRVTPVIAAHLTDDARLVRVSAAEALMTFGITQLDGAPGQALARAQDEWAESLRTFNDVSADHTLLGRLEAARGRSDQAAKEFRTAIDLDPRDPQPHVHLGVLAARAGRYDEALQHFKTAKTIAPAYQNLDRLIEETSKRTAKRD
jgi:tetratricopeptide (TPR) repeat protein